MSCEAMSLSTSYSCRINPISSLKPFASSICSHINSPVSDSVTILLESCAVSPAGINTILPATLRLINSFVFSHLCRCR